MVDVGEKLCEVYIRSQEPSYAVLEVVIHLIREKKTLCASLSDDSASTNEESRQRGQMIDVLDLKSLYSWYKAHSNHQLELCRELLAELEIKQLTTVRSAGSFRGLLCQIVSIPSLIF